MTKIEQIEKLLETAKVTKAREDLEVTVDHASVEAEYKIKTLEEVLKILRGR